MCNYKVMTTERVYLPMYILNSVAVVRIHLFYCWGCVLVSNFLANVKWIWLVKIVACSVCDFSGYQVWAPIAQFPAAEPKSVTGPGEVIASLLLPYLSTCCVTDKHRGLAISPPWYSTYLLTSHRAFLCVSFSPPFSNCNGLYSFSTF